MKNTHTLEFEKFKPQLKSFILRMTASVEDTEDLLQDTFIKVSENLDTFQNKSSFRTWVFAIASNLAKNSLRSKMRWTDNVTDLAKAATLESPHIMQGFIQVHQVSPHGAFEIREHIGFCFTCIGKTLPIEQQIALLLKEVYEFKVAEIAEILEETEGVVKHLLFNGRQKMIAVFDKRCSLINKKGICHQCSELNGIFNPKHETQKELMKIDMVNEAVMKSKEELFDMRTRLIKAIDPFNSPGCDLQLFHLRHARNTIEKAQENQ
ncbi:MAG TPA: RNA polymerase sigma factor [Chryseolinea sp.]|nr:RNA polymerase sigma factor [Chryseolinea sp.]